MHKKKHSSIRGILETDGIVFISPHNKILGIQEFAEILGKLIKNLPLKNRIKILDEIKKIRKDTIG